MKLTYYKKYTEALVVAIKETGLEVDADIPSMYMVMSRDHYTGQSHNIRT